MVHDTWTGPTYLSGLAGELHTSVLWVTLLCSAAWIGAVGQLVGAWAYERVPSYKQYTLALASASRALWLLPLFMAAYWYRRGGAAGFPVGAWCALTALVACAAALFGASSATAWSSWVRGLVPEEVRGRFFGERQRYVMVALVGANLVASLCVDWRPGGSYAGFALLGVLTLTAAGLSTGLLARVPDAGTPSGHAPNGAREFAQTLLAPLRDPSFRGVVIYGAAFNGALQLASPYFPYYFTRELGIPMSQIAFWTVLTNAGCLLAAGRWGQALDRSAERARPVMRAMGTLVAISPLYYVVQSRAFVHAIAPWDYLANGAIWVGYWLALTMLLYRSIPAGAGTALCFSIYTAAAGLCGALGSLTGGALADRLAPWGGFRALFVVSALARLAVLWGLYGLITETRPAARSSRSLARSAPPTESTPPPQPRPT